MQLRLLLLLLRQQARCDNFCKYLANNFEFLISYILIALPSICPHFGLNQYFWAWKKQKFSTKKQFLIKSEIIWTSSKYFFCISQIFFSPFWRTGHNIYTTTYSNVHNCKKSYDPVRKTKWQPFLLKLTYSWVNYGSSIIASKVSQIISVMKT